MYKYSCPKMQSLRYHWYPVQNHYNTPEEENELPPVYSVLRHLFRTNMYMYFKKMMGFKPMTLNTLD